jgi:hypothetical protein
MRYLLTPLVCGALALAQPAAPVAKTFVPSDELNAQLPKWLRFNGEYRARLEGFGGGGFRNDNDDLYFLNRFRLNMRLEPAPWLRFHFQGQDARVFWKTQKPYAPPFQDRMDLRMAFVEIGEPEKKTFGMRVGRQELFFGEQRLVGHVSWLNTARTFDAVRASFRHNGYRFDAFAASVVNIRDGEFNRRVDGNNFHGIYGGLEKLIPNAVVEPYAFWRLAPRVDFKTWGVRVAGKLPANLDYGTEMAKQSGSTDAWAGHWRLGYTLPAFTWKPRLIAEYNYATPTFDVLYPTPHDKYGLSDQVGWKNIHHIRVGPEFKISKRVNGSANYHTWWLVNPANGLYNAGGALLVRSPAGNGSKHIGQEVDGQVMVAVNKQVSLSGGYAHIIPGSFLKKATPGASYNFPYLMLGYTF